MSAAELFQGAGEAAGIQIWRIEALKPVAQGKEALSGKLCTGDSYIILHSIPTKSGGFDYNLHFWLGEESSQDEKGCAVRARVAACVGGWAAARRGVRSRRFGSAREAPRAAPRDPRAATPRARW
jgi:hypothetical protein